MTMPAYDSGSSEWWRQRLIQRLLDRRADIRLYDDYYGGHHRLTFASSKYREAFGNLFRSFADNFCLLVVDAQRERLNVEGFRVGEDGSADADAWRIWQENDLDARSAIAHTEALVKGICYVAVWAGADGRPLITIEDPAQVIVEQDFGGRGPRQAALKMWRDTTDKLFLTLYLPDRIEKWQTRDVVKADTPPTTEELADAKRWERRDVEGEDWPLPNALGVVPIVPLVNNPRLSGDGRSEIANVIPLQDAINKTVSDMLIASEFGAFRQRWVTGIEIPLDENNNPIEPFKTAIDRLWVANPSEGGQQPQFGEFSQTDLTPFVRVVEMFVQHIASQTKTPPHYLLGQSGTFPSGEALKATETGLVAKSKLAMRYFGETWEEVMRLAFLVMGDERALVTDSETIWRDPESKVQSELTDAVTKEMALGIPQEALWEKLGYTPQQIARFKRMQARQALISALNPPAPAPLVVASNGAVS